ncbi:MAG: asparagine synthase-related protein, partial [Hyphomicrobiales bacterium]
PEPRTIFTGVRKLPPAHRVVFRKGDRTAAPEPYWDVTFAEGGAASAASEDRCGAELLERMRDGVRVRLVSEVPLGAFLSGGVDSSGVVAMMASLQSEPVHTCTIAFGEPRFDESEYASEVARRYGTDHLAERVSPDLFDLVDRLASFYDEPYADSSAMPTYRLCGLARKRVTVALSGDGGDENVAGYRRYRWHMVEERVRGVVPGPVRRPLFGLAARLYPKADWAPRWLRAKATLEGIARDSVEAYHHTVSLAREGTRARLFHDDLKRTLGGYRAIEVMRRHAAHGPRHDPLSLIQYLDLKTYLPGDILTKVDRASMAHSLEVRVPLLDHPLVEWLATVPPGLKLRGREGKYLLKRALEPHLPHDLLYRPKMGFGVPIGLWFRGPLKQRLQESLLGPGIAARGFFEPEFVARLVREHQSGQREHSAVLWSLLMFDASLRHLDALRPTGPAWRESETDVPPARVRAS